MVIVLALEERLKIGFDPIFEIGLHGNRVESGGMREGNRSPASAATITIVFEIDEEPQISLFFLLELVGNRVYVLEVRAEDSSSIGSPELQNEGPGGGGVVLVDPRKWSSEEIVLDELVRVEAEDDVVRFLAGEEVGEI